MTSNVNVPVVVPAPNILRGDDVAADDLRVTGRLIARQEGAGGASAQCHYVDKVLPDGGSSANCRTSRKRLAGMDVEPRNRTLSECVQGYLFGVRPAAASTGTRTSRKRGEGSEVERSLSEAEAEAEAEAGGGESGG